jgi:hypothetical protein
VVGFGYANAALPGGPLCLLGGVFIQFSFSTVQQKKFRTEEKELIDTSFLFLYSLFLLSLWARHL